MAEVRAGQIWCDQLGYTYRVIAIARDVETSDPRVVYECQRSGRISSTWAARWQDLVDVSLSADAWPQMRPRHVLVEDV